MADTKLQREDEIDQRVNDMFSSGAQIKKMEENNVNPSINTDGEQYSKGYTSDPKDSGQNISQVQDKESEAGWQQNYTGKGANESTKLDLKGFTKQKGPLGLIITLFLGGGVIGGGLLTPGIGIVQMKEMFAKDLNDQLGAQTIRSNHLLRTKLNNSSAAFSVCGSKVQIRCKFSSMSKREINKFKKAGFEVESKPAGTGALGREKITAMKSPSGEVINNPADILNSRDIETKSAIRRAYNPRFMGLFDKVAVNTLGRLGASKNAKVTGATDTERDKSVTSQTKGAQGLNADGTRPIQTDADGNQYVIDDKGNKVLSTDPNFEKLSTENVNSKLSTDVKESTKVSGSTATKSVLKSGAKGVSILGAADTACTVYNTARAVSAAAKAERALQLARFAMIYLSVADKIKAGKATPEEVEYLGKKLTATDSNKTIKDETSIKGGEFSSDKSKYTTNINEKPNPFYGKNAFDSPGYKVAAYNEAPKLTSRSSQYMVGGALVGTLSSVISAVNNIVGDPKNECKKIQSWWMRTIGVVGGLIAAAGSFGASAYVSIGVSIAIGFALPFLTAALADIIAGNVVNGGTSGVDAGDAIFAGSATVMGGIAMSRGMKPAKKSELQTYLAATEGTKRDLIAVETYDAKGTPFDAYNQYSMLGSVVSSLYPTAQSISNNPSSAVSSIPRFVFSTLHSSLNPRANADSTSFNPDRFSQCNDDTYKDLGIDADVFCNPRYVMSNKELSMDPVANLNWMISNSHIDEDTGEAKSDNYKKWVKNCAERQDGWGEAGDQQGENGSRGNECLDNGGEYDNETLSHFRVYRMDSGTLDGMEDGPQNGSGISTGAGTDTSSGYTTAGSDAKSWYQDFSNVQCAAGSNDIGMSNGGGYLVDGIMLKFPIRMCALNDLPQSNISIPGANGHAVVSSAISKNWVALLTDAKQAGISLSATSSYRTLQDQCSILSRNGYSCTPGQTNGSCHNGRCDIGPVGFSNHGLGLAIDLSNLGGICNANNSAAYLWMRENSRKYELGGNDEEPWHYDKSFFYINPSNGMRC